MTREVFTFDAKDFLTSARSAFVSANGFTEHNNKHRRMMDLSEEVLSDILPSVRPIAIVSSYGSEALTGDTITADAGFEFASPAFSQFDQERIRHIYPFMLTVGDVKTSLEGITARVFADMWATVFCDVIVAALSEKLTAPITIYPGFYGLPLSNILQFSKLLDGEKIGISVREPGFIMLPVKSCCGLMFEAVGQLPLQEDSCEECMANRHWCIMCKKNRV